VSGFYGGTVAIIPSGSASHSGGFDSLQPAPVDGEMFGRLKIGAR